MIVTPTELPGVVILQPKLFGDSRGFLLEIWNEARYAEAGLTEQFVQDNLSSSVRGVLRGLHFQHPGAQGKLVSVLQGEVFDVAVDVRRGSSSFGRWTGVVLSADNRQQMYIPAGFAHGFQVMSDDALFSYKCTAYYRPETEVTVSWDDPDIGIAWPIENPVLSAKDRSGYRLKDLPLDRQPPIST